jgi:pimeloyl-ACP methyl ester carboxylesterase
LGTFTKNKKRKIALIIVFSIIGFLTVAFFSYWGYTSQKINQFAATDFKSIQENQGFITLRGAEIHYIQKGSGEQTIILVHGLGGGAFTFRNNIDALADKGYKVYAIDLKGFGFSEKVIGSDYSHIEQAKILLDFMEKKGIEKATVAGHSMGGRIALIAYDMKPQNFDSIILIDSAGLENNSPAFYNLLITQPIVDILYYNIFVKEKNFQKFLSSAFFNSDFVSPEVIRLYLEPFKIKNANRAFLSILKSNSAYDIDSVLKKINIPVLIIWGRNDGWISLESAYRFNLLIKDSELAVIDNAGHVSMEEQPEAVNNKIIEFLDKF